MSSKFAFLMVGMSLLMMAPPVSAQQSPEELLEDAMLLTPRTLRALVDSAESGDVEAQYQVALAYGRGYGVRAMPNEAVKWATMAADQGFAPAQYLLGTMYRDGEGVEQDATEAAKWFRMAAEQRLADAEFEYGLMLFDGVGVTQDQSEAFEWFQSAAEHGSVAGQTYVGIMYVNGLGVSADPDRGYQALEDAANQGSPMAQANLGALYANGVGVGQDPAEALVWFLVAQQGGFEGVDPLIADVSATMSPTEVTAATDEATRRREEILANLAGGPAAAAPEDDESLAALEEIGVWLTEHLTSAGSFSVGIAREVTGFRRRGSGGAGGTAQGRSEIQDVALDGCTLTYVNVLTRIPRRDTDLSAARGAAATPLSYEQEVDLGAVMLDELRVRPLQLADGFQTSGGQAYEVHLRAAGFPVRYFTVIGPDGAADEIQEVAIPIGDRGEADAVAGRIREAAAICGAQ